MKNSILILIVFLAPVVCLAQNTPMYTWQEHLAYKNAKLILEVGERIYCATEIGLYYYHQNDYTINRINKINGLSEIKISAMAYDQENEIIIISYENCNVDLINKDGLVTNIPDIKLKEIFGDKEIYSLYVYNGTCYIASSFGLILLDINKKEIKETYSLMFGGEECLIYNCNVLNNYFVISTSCGKFQADISSSNLNDFNNWDVDTTSTHLIDFYYNYNADTVMYIYSEMSIPLSSSIILINNGVYDTISDQNQKATSYTNNYLHRIHNNKILICKGLNLYNSDTFQNADIQNINYSITDINKKLWVADSVNSLIKINDNYPSEIISPSGPSSNKIENIICEQGSLTVLHNVTRNSVSKSTDLIDWQEINQMQNVVCSKINLGKTYYGSSTNGLFIENGINDFSSLYLQNTNNILDSNDNIAGLAVDVKENLWGTRSFSSHPLFCRSSDGNWFSFSMPFVASSSTEIGEIIIDDYDQKWGIIHGGGIFVYNDNNTIEETADDQFTKLGTSIGSGNLPDKQVYCITKDIEGDIWVGTKAGVCVFYSPSSVFSGYNFDAQQIIVQENGFGQYLLESEIVYSIAVDKGNRKWIGTSSGVYLLSENGTEEIHHFTEKNSPLMSNTVTDITINHETGEVFFATDKGLISYRSDATEKNGDQNDVLVFPNPIREGYNGYISINGLSHNSEVKITDISGNLVFQTRTNGSTAVWNGKDVNGEKIATGVYLIFNSSISGEEENVGKMLFIK